MNYKIEFSSKAYKYLKKLDLVTKTRMKIGPRGDFGWLFKF
jgi:hypothetical protein